MGSILSGILGGLDGGKESSIPTEKLLETDKTPTNWVAIGAMVAFLALIVFLIIKFKK